MAAAIVGSTRRDHVRTSPDRVSWLNTFGRLSNRRLARILCIRHRRFGIEKTMPAPFKQISREQFGELLQRFEFKRKVNAVHMHHTWRPNHSQYDPANGHKAILGMFLHHTQTNGWQDIAQHITIAPDGSIWLGRNWNLPPASASGHNGNGAIGPFMFEIIGDFDVGQDRFEGEQRETVLDVIARVQKHFKLPPESLKFHNSMSLKSCPGTAIDHDEVLGRACGNGISPWRRKQRRAGTRAPGPFGAEAREIDQVIEDALDSLGREIPRAVDPANAEPTYEDAERTVVPIAGAQARA